MIFLLRCPMPIGNKKQKECYALLIANITSLSSTYENYNNSKVEEAFKKWNCSTATNILSCPSGSGGHPPPPPDEIIFLCHRCKFLESSVAYWNGPNLTKVQYGALLTRNAAG